MRTARIICALLMAVPSLDCQLPASRDGSIPDRVVGHALSDTLAGLKHRAESLRDGFQFQTAALVWASLADSLLIHGDTIGFYQGSLRRAEDLISAGQYSAVPEILETALERSGSNLGEMGLKTANALRLIGRAYSRLGRHAEAIEAQSKALSIRVDILGDRHVDVAQSYHDLGLAYHEDENLSRAYEEYVKSLDLRAILGHESSREAAATLNNIGNIHWAEGDYAEAIRIHAAALDIKQQLLRADDPDIATSLDNLGNVYTDAGDIEDGLAYHRRALEIREQFLRDHLFVGFTLNNIGGSLFEQGSPKESLYYYRRALDLISASTSEANQYVSGTEYELSLALLAVGDTSAGLALLQRTSRVLQTLGDDKAIPALIDLAAVETQRGRDNRKAYLEKAIILRRHLGPAARPHEARLYNSWAEYSLSKDEFEQALQYADTSISSNLLLPSGGILKSSPTEIVRSYSEYIDSIDLKCRAMLRLAADDDTRELVHLNAILDLVRNMIRVMTAVRRGFVGTAAKASISASMHRILTTGIDVALRLHRETDKIRYFNDAFEFSELRRGGVLLDKAEYSEALRVAGVPDSLRRRRTELMSELAFVRARLNDSSQAPPDSQIIGSVHSLSERLLAARQSLERFETKLLVSYPRLRALARHSQVIQVPELQSLLAQRKSTLVEYALGDSSLHIFVVSPDTAVVVSSTVDDQFTGTIRSFVSSVRSESQTDLLDSGWYVYSALLGPISPLIETEVVTVIPDGELFTVPFEALPTERIIDSTMDWGTLPFAIHRWAFSYAYSASLLTPPREDNTSHRGNELLAIAPVFETAVSISSSPGDSLRFGPIPNTLLEVIGIGSLFDRSVSPIEIPPPSGAVIVTGSRATEERIRTLDLSQFRYLHFATHAFFSANNPQSSGIILFPSESPEYDDVIRTSEVYGLDLDADLVALSACDTGVGPFHAGEGVMGLAHAFLYAGAHNVMASLWIGEDTSTAQIVLHFYDSLFDGMPMERSLAEAKRGVILDNPMFASPMYWAHLILVVA